MNVIEKQCNDYAADLASVEYEDNSFAESVEEYIRDNESNHEDFLVFVEGDLLTGWTIQEKKRYCKDEPAFDGIQPTISDYFCNIKSKDLLKLIVKESYTLHTDDGQTFGRDW